MHIQEPEKGLLGQTTLVWEDAKRGAEKRGRLFRSYADKYYQFAVSWLIDDGHDYILREGPHYPTNTAYIY